jgi:hypothetical protein
MSDKTTDLLQQLQSGEITLEECQKTLNQVQKVESQVHYKVSTKGCISFYGIRRMPISLYQQELEQMLGAIMDAGTSDLSYNQTFKDFLVENEGKLSNGVKSTPVITKKH